MFSRMFTDDPVASRAVPIKAAHFTELGEAVNTVRARYGLGSFGWSRSTAAPGGTVLKEHLTDLRTALTQAYQAAGRTPPGFAETIVARETLIKASHINELRTFVRALE